MNRKHKFLGFESQSFSNIYLNDVSYERIDQMQNWNYFRPCRYWKDSECIANF